MVVVVVVKKNKKRPGSRTLKCSGGIIRCTDTSGGLQPDNPEGLVVIDDWAAVKTAI